MADLIDSVLETVKKQIGIEPEYTHFDPDIVMAINSAFVILCQLGVGPDKPYSIEDKYNTWDEFEGPGVSEAVKTIIGLRVKLIFDPPTNSYLIDNIEKQIRELEYRLLVNADEELQDVSE